MPRQKSGKALLHVNVTVDGHSQTRSYRNDQDSVKIHLFITSRRTSFASGVVATADPLLASNASVSKTFDGHCLNHLQRCPKAYNIEYDYIQELTTFSLM